MTSFPKNLQFYKFAAYGFLKNLKFFDIFFLLFLKEAGLTYFQVGLLYSIRQITINVFEVPSGVVADAMGRKKALIFALSSYIASFIIFYSAQSFALLALAMMAFGLGEAFRSGTHKAIILQYLLLNDLLEYKSQYYGGTRSWSQLGSALSSLLAIPIVFYGGNYNVLFLYAVIPYFIDLLLITSYPKELDYGHQAEGLHVNFKAGLFLAPIVQTLRSFAAIFRQADSVKALFNAAAYIAFFKGTKDYLQPLLKITVISLPLFLTINVQRRTAILTGLVYFFIFLMTSYASRNAWKLEKALRHLPKAIDSLYLVGVASVIVAGILLIFNLPIAAAFIFTILFLIQNLRRPLALSYLSEKIDSKVMASGLSAESQIETILVAAYAPLLGWLVDLCGEGGGLLISALIFLAAYPLIRLHKSSAN